MADGDIESRYGLPPSKTNPESRLIQLRREELLREFLGLFQAVEAGAISPEAAAKEQTDKFLKLEEENGHDPLTGLLNRRGFFEAFDTDLLVFSRTIHSVPEGAVDDNPTLGCLVLIDLDNFGALNKTRGDSFGDSMLQQVAVALIDGIRPDDHAARFGGEEFVLFLRGADSNSGVKVVERLRDSLPKHSLSVLGQEQTGTFAVVEFPRNLTATQLKSPEFRGALFKQAYEDTIEAKNAGKKEGKNVTMIKRGPGNFQKITT